MSDGDTVANEVTNSVIEQPPVVNDAVNTADIEKQVPQSTVNALIGSAKRDSYEKGRKEALASAQPTSDSTPVNATAQLTQDDIARMIDETASKKSNDAYAQKTVDTFISKVKAGATKHDDYETSVAQLNIPAVPQLVPLLNDLDNTDEVLYELSKNTGKYAEVLTLMNSSPALAKSRLEQLSKSITANKEAVNSNKSVPEPLSKIKPSLTATDNGTMTISELRKLPRNRKF